MKPFKIRVESEEHSKEIQEFVFNHGYTWVSGGNQVKNTNSPFLYLHQDLEVGKDKANLYVGSYEWDFVEDELPEKWFYDGKLQDSPKPKDKANTFRELSQAQLDGKTLQVDFFGEGWVDCTHTLEQVRVEDIDKPVRGYRVKPKTRICNGVELDECIKEPLRDGEEYYIAYPINDYSVKLVWNGDRYDLNHLNRGISYLKEESAIKHAKAMLNLSD